MQMLMCQHTPGDVYWRPPLLRLEDSTYILICQFLITNGKKTRDDGTSTLAELMLSPGLPSVVVPVMVAVLIKTSPGLKPGLIIPVIVMTPPAPGAKSWTFQVYEILPVGVMDTPLLT